MPALPSAVAYYRDTLGLKLLREEKTVAAFQLSDGQSELILHTDADRPGEEIYYLVDDLRAIYRDREMLKLRFLTPPQRSTKGNRAAVRDPFGNVLQLLDRTGASDAQQIETAQSPTTLFAGVEARVAVKRDALIAAYEKIGRTADDLPYTPHFESLYKTYCAAHTSEPPSRHEVWRHLLNLRKSGKLPKLGEAKSQPPAISPEDRARLKELLGSDVGKRDRLPYTPRFDKLVDEFNRTMTRTVSPHLVWRLVATLAK